MKFSEYCKTDAGNQQKSYDINTKSQFNENSTEIENIRKNYENIRKNDQNTQKYSQNYQNFENIDIDDNIKNMFSKYQSMTETELQTELIKEVNKQKQSGNFSPQKISEIKDAILPFLNDEQKQKLEQIIKMLG